MVFLCDLTILHKTASCLFGGCLLIEQSDYFVLFPALLAFELTIEPENEMKKLLMMVLLVLFFAHTQAAVFCVKSATQLQTALNDASSNGQDDEIRIQVGDYITPNSQFMFINDEGFDLAITGGWFSIGNIDCVVQRTYPLLTTLDGNNSTPVMWFSSDGYAINVTVSNLSVINGFTTLSGLNSGLGLYITNTQDSNILVDQVYFAGNQSPAGSALRMGGGHLLTVRNSVFQDNITNSGFGTLSVNMLADAKGFYFINNTLLDNQTDSTWNGNNNTAGLSMSLSENAQNIPQALIANNLFWGNENSDFFVSAVGGMTYLYNNNYENGGGTFADQANNMSLPPQLSAAALDFTPAPDSPLIDSGYGPFVPIITLPFEQNWHPGDEDFDDGAPLGQNLGRVIGSGLDIGAVEAPDYPIFKDGFE